MRTSLLPIPKSFRPDPGNCRPGPDCQVEISIEDPRVGLALSRWRSGLGQGEAATDSPGADGLEHRMHADAPVRIRVGIDPAQAGHPHGYRLKIRPTEIELVGGSPQGCFHGLQTLILLHRTGLGAIRCGTIEDQPDLGSRGLLHDVTRGRVPTLSTLEMLADRLAALKINQLQLNIEHAFVFSFDPEICSEGEGLTPDEVRSLDAYCRDRFIDLVPAVATFGHMGRILTMPKYRHLAEIEPADDWNAMSWPQRLRGLTLDCTSPEARELVRNMWSDILDAFSAPIANICGDEPWDLGQGKNAERLAAVGTADAYLDHLLYTYDVCASRGRSVQAWGDIIRNHPELVDRLPNDLTVLHWGYDDAADYDGTALFTGSGLNTLACPGTTGWKRILNAMNLAERNIAAFSEAARKHGATGLLNTDWGDHGHFNLLACSWHGIALGAARAWNVDQPTGEDFDSSFAKFMFHVDGSDPIRLLRDASDIAGSYETWPLLYRPLQENADDVELPAHDAVAKSRESAREFQDWRKTIIGHDATVQADLDELAIVCRFTEILADKIDLVRDALTGNRAQWPEELKEAGEVYAGCWHARYKPVGLTDIDRAFAAAAADVMGRRRT